jgi:hypothetical protein
MSIGDAVWWIFAAIMIVGAATNFEYRRGENAGVNLLGMTAVWLIPLGIAAIIFYITV